MLTSRQLPLYPPFSSPSPSFFSFTHSSPTRCRHTSSFLTLLFLLPGLPQLLTLWEVDRDLQSLEWYLCPHLSRRHKRMQRSRNNDNRWPERRGESDVRTQSHRRTHPRMNTCTWQNVLLWFVSHAVGRASQTCLHRCCVKIPPPQCIEVTDLKHSSLRFSHKHTICDLQTSLAISVPFQKTNKHISRFLPQYGLCQIFPWGLIHYRGPESVPESLSFCCVVEAVVTMSHWNHFVAKYLDPRGENESIIFIQEQFASKQEKKGNVNKWFWVFMLVKTAVQRSAN